MQTPTPSKGGRGARAQHEEPEIRSTPQGGSLPVYVEPLARCPVVTWFTCSLGLGLVTVTNPVVAPTPTALTHHVHASCHAQTTHTTTQAAPSDRHPLSEGMRPGTGMQGYLSQATITASEPRRSPGAALARPSAPASEGTRPPSPIDALRPLEPPQQLAYAAVAALKTATASPLPSTGVRHGTQSHRYVSSTTNEMGPDLEQEQS